MSNVTKAGRAIREGVTYRYEMKCSSANRGVSWDTYIYRENKLIGKLGGVFPARSTALAADQLAGEMQSMLETRFSAH